MAAIETKVIQMKNDTALINENNELYSCFGWRVNSVQVTHTQDHKVEQLYNTISVETKTYDYATVTYERDTGIENYAEVVELEKAYYSLKKDRDALDKSINKDEAKGCLKAFLLFIFWPVGIFYLVSGKYKENNGDTENSRKRQLKQEMNEKLMEIRAEAKALL